MSFLLALLLLTGVAGCKAEKVPPSQTEPIPEATVPQDGNRTDVTCKGSYTVSEEALREQRDTVVAMVRDRGLTNGMLQVYYWAAVEDYRKSGQEPAPDFSKPLDTQTCPLEGDDLTWQQYFLQRAVDHWAVQQAMILKGELEGMPTEEAYQPSEKYHARRLGGVVGRKDLIYGYSHETYRPNKLHQAFLDGLPETVETIAREKGYENADAMARDLALVDGDVLTNCAEVFNRSYMYFTEMNYRLSVSQEEAESRAAEAAGTQISFRNLLLIPEDGTQEAQDACQEQAEKLLKQYEQDPGEDTFAELANDHSLDTGTAVTGGLYCNVRKGQLEENLDRWCFDAERQPGDVTILESSLGLHLVYFGGAEESGIARAREEVLTRKQAEMLSAAAESYPVLCIYSRMVLGQPERTGNLVRFEDLLYPDVAHERYPEMPIYLQQDYPGSRYGNYPLASYGCGITAMSMLATYMTDQEYTPPELASRYGKYCGEHGTSSSLFMKVPGELGFFLIKQTNSLEEVMEAIRDGKIGATLQHKGYFTRGGHYMVLPAMTEDGLMVIRDSNIHNYGKLIGHEIDAHDPQKLQTRMYWIYEPKVTRIPVCSRCGDPENCTQGIVTEDYICEKCTPAIQRRESYINYFE